MVELSLENIDAAIAAGEDLNSLKMEVKVSESKETQPPDYFDPIHMTIDDGSPESKIRQLRARIRSSNRDPLADRQQEMVWGLEESGYTQNDMGKTGDSRTGEVSEKHKKIAAHQIQDAKEHILYSRMKKDSHEF